MTQWRFCMRNNRFIGHDDDDESLWSRENIKNVSNYLSAHLTLCSRKHNGEVHEKKKILFYPFFCGHQRPYLYVFKVQFLLAISQWNLPRVPPRTSVGKPFLIIHEEIFVALEWLTVAYNYLCCSFILFSG